MTWTKLGDDFTDSREMALVSRSARLLHVEALVWSNRILTDGEVPAAMLRRISDSEDLDADAGQLEAVGLWVRKDAATWQIDWGDQEQAEAVKLRQQAQKQKQKRYRERKARHDLGDDSLCDPKHCRRRARHDKDDHEGCDGRWCKSVPYPGNETSNTTGLVTTSRPARPGPKGQGPGPCKIPGHNGAAGVDADGDLNCPQCVSDRTRAVAS